MARKYLQNERTVQKIYILYAEILSGFIARSGGKMVTTGV
jgi:hypothetical protein